MGKMTFYGQCPDCNSVLWGVVGHHPSLAEVLRMHILSRSTLHVIVRDDDNDDICISRHADNCQNGL